MASFIKRAANAFKVLGGRTPYFEAASRSSRLHSLNPSKEHINRAIGAAGETLTARSRWLYDNEPIYGSAVDEWVSAVVSDGIKPHPRIQGYKKQKSQLLNLWWQWVDEADFYGTQDFYGLQSLVAREVFMTGECFVRLRLCEPDDVSVPLKLEIYPTEMLDVTYDAPAEIEGHYIRMGIEFNAQGQRVAYHFFRFHPHDERPQNVAGFDARERVRLPAEQIIHIKESRQAGQLRGSPKITRSLVKLFQLEAYDDAELERKKTSALFSAFLVGRGDDFFGTGEKGEVPDIPEIKPGAVVDLGDERDIRFSTPTEVGGSYEPFQYRNLLKICAGLNMPYAVVTGDVTRGNFSNVRTAIIQFRRHVKQWRANVMAFQLNRVIWSRFVEVAVMAGVIELPKFDENPTPWLQCESFAPPLEMIEPLKDIAAEKEEIRAGLKSRTMALNERGYDRDDIDAEIADECDDAASRGLVFDTDMAGNDDMTTPPLSDDEGGYEANQGAESHS